MELNKRQGQLRSLYVPTPEEKKEMMEILVREYKAGTKCKDICAMLHISKPCLYKYLSQALEKGTEGLEKRQNQVYTKPRGPRPKAKTTAI